MLTAFLIAVAVAAPLTNPNTMLVIVASLLGLGAMGVQSATVRLLMRSASTNVMTTNTTQVAIDVTELVLAWRACRRAPTDAAMADALERSRARCAGLVPIMLGFLLGTAAGTLAYVTTGLWGLLVPLAIMYGIFAWASARQTLG
jgi:uncharacterized membrane protein YoaK (UPF0700 family)